MSFHNARVLCLFESCWIHHSSQQFPGARSASLFFFCKALPHGFFAFSIFWIDEMNASKSSSVINLWFVRLPILASLSSELFFPCRTKLQPRLISWWLLEFFVGLSPNHMCPLGGFSFNRVNFVNPFQDSVNFDSRPHSNSHQYVLLVTRPD